MAPRNVVKISEAKAKKAAEAQTRNVVIHPCASAGMRNSFPPAT